MTSTNNGQVFFDRFENNFSVDFPLTIIMFTAQDLIRDVDKITAQAKALDDSLGKGQKLGYL